jgi:hypothetical protein
MSKALSRVRALVTEIDAIQTGGRKYSSSVPLARAVDAVKALQSDQSSQFQASSGAIPPMGAESGNVYPLNAGAGAAATPVAPATPEGKILIQMTGKIAVQLQMDDTDEIVEVRQLGEMIEIRFNDGKAIHLPLKNVA